MSYNKVKVSAEGDIAVITLSDPATLNAASVEMGAEIADALKVAAYGTEPKRAVVITGEGKGFCSGANLQAGPGGGKVDPDGKPDAGAALETLYNPMVSVIRDLPIPVVTAVNGPAAGVGCSIGLMGDLIVAAESAYFLQAFRRIGLVPDGGSTYILPRMIGKARAMEMMLLGEKIPAAQALEWGMVNRVVSDADLLPTALGLAKQLAEGPMAIGLIRRMVWQSLDSSWTEQLNIERQTQRIAGKTEDFREGVAAFLGKRPAAFKGR
ncbi:enoyl-CoA hydratase/isomerase [Phenylobacterium montanum]|uniref:Enoyl-CoA hydratase/isomerase n=1 Tax=Phenylobacterium montanum TaxID=2823693 RepID=A0A975G389_9CAUL|nr:enoyl-CoA hydratase/isomerase [Caulobacter sp. S6]QUD89697.1 enoyl-CoA hydratase/isomerase [Caulobacter sp. S6]